MVFARLLVRRERVVAIGYHIPQVSQRNDVSEHERITTLDKHFQHDLQSGAFTLPWPYRDTATISVTFTLAGGRARASHRGAAPGVEVVVRMRR